MVTVLIFDLEVAGHHPGYLRHLLRYWPDGNTQLIFVVSPELVTRHEDVVGTTTKARVTWQPITQEELRWYTESKRSLVRRTWVEWRLYCRYARKVQADQGLIMYIDRFQLPLALQLFLPCKTSGIFFRPKLHYVKFANHRSTRRERIHALREQWLWWHALRHPNLKTLFCLDPFAVEPLSRLSRNANILALPDPIEWYGCSTTASTPLRQDLGIEAERKILLLFGMIDRRKGIYQALEAVQQLSAAQQAQLALLLVGPLAEADKANVLAQIDAITQHSAVQIVVRDDFIRDTQIQSYFDLADLVLALYQRHVGMSAILVRAAAAGKPVLASEYGLMGELVQRHRLGMTVDSTQPNAVVAGIKTFLSPEPVHLFDKSSVGRFAQANSAHHFSGVIWQQLMN